MSDSGPVTRETFAGLTHGQIAVWYSLIALSVLLFLGGVVRLGMKYAAGRRAGTIDRPAVRAGRAVRVVAAHSWIGRRDPLAGAGHALVFYGFLVLFAGTIILAFEGDFLRPAFGLEFWRGWFYRGYSLALDLFGLALVAGLAVMTWKRGVERPFRLSYWRPDRAEGEYDRRPYRVGDWAFLASLAFLALTGFLLEALRIAWSNPPFEVWAPVGWTFGQLFRALGLDGGAADDARLATWWVHGVVALFWVSAIPYTKALHMLTGPAAVGLRGERPGPALPPLPAGARAEEVGYSRIVDFAPAHLVDLDACTKCGKCHAACPATRSGYPLSPRDLILDLREVAEGSLGIRASYGLPPLHDAHASVLGDPIRPETLWSCMQCLACVEICPVGIEHVPIIVQLRRQLVERGELDAQLRGTLETIVESGNSFGEAKRKRPRWARELDFEVADARKRPVDVLWFVGDYASYDPRNQRATRALARLLHAAGVDFGILGDAERNAGNDVRRVGEEGLFLALAQENIAAISQCEFQRILTSDPHSYNTLRNEYPQLGGSWPVVHHSQLLLELLEAGALRVGEPVGRTVTYHDPCALGRYNGVYEEPRRVLELAGAELREMPRNRDDSFCCGAGGGRIWMQELQRPGSRRPAEQRIDEAVALGGAEWFVVACPKDVTMYEDAIKTSGHDGSIELRELSEVVLAAVALGEPAAAPAR